MSASVRYFSNLHITALYHNAVYIKSKVILERDSALSATKALEVKLLEIRHHVQEVRAKPQITTLQNFKLNSFCNQMTEALENQEDLFRRKLKSRRLKFDRKITRSRLMVKDRLVLLNHFSYSLRKIIHYSTTEMRFSVIG